MNIQSDLLQLLVQRSLLTTGQPVPQIKQEPLLSPLTTPASFSPISSPVLMTSYSSPPASMTSPVPVITSRAPEAGIPSPPSTPVPSFLVSSPELSTYIKSSPGSVSPSRDITTTTPSRDNVVMTTPLRSSALSPPFSLSPESGLNYQNTGSPNMPFICAVSTVTSITDKAELDMFHTRTI